MTLKSLLKRVAYFSGIEKNSVDLLSKFYNFFGYKYKKEFFVLFIGAIISGVIELLGLILLYYLIRLMIDIKALSSDHFVLRFFDFFGLKNKSLVIPVFGAMILFIFVLKNVYIMFYYHIQHLILRKWKNEISTYLMERYLNSPYIFLIGYNSATIIRNVSSTVGGALNGFVLSALTYGSNIITGAIILSLLWSQYPVVTSLIGLILICTTIIQNKYLKKIQVKLGKEREQLASDQTKSVYQGLHAVKETKVVGKEKYFLETFKDINTRTIENEMKSLFYSRLPAHLTEITIVIAIILITTAVLMKSGNDASISISTLGVLAAIAFRLAPIMNRTISALQSMNKSVYSMSYLFEEIDKLKNLKMASLNRNNVDKVPFHETIQLKDITFRYPTNKRTCLKSISFEIKKGEFVGIVGSSGAGKTTLVDIILGLLEADSGSITIDGTKISAENITGWQKNLGYVPQNVFIGDTSIAENIAFGIKKSEIDRELVNETIKDVNLNDYIRRLSEGIDFIVGENGKKMSGGQKQRIGIARALYQKAEVLVLDEATSALDVPTEMEISAAINKIRGEKTVIVIAHRLSTIFDADKIIYIENGEIQDIGSYKDLYERNENFNKLGRLAKVTPH